MKPTTLKLLAAFGAGSIASLSIFFAVRARAAGIPDADVLTYTGYLEAADGAPLTGDHSIAVRFWDSVDGTSDVCTGSSDSVTLQSGRFQVPLPKECADGVKANPNLWVDVQVDGASLGRTKLGAVPFAVEAGHATASDLAASATSAESAKAASGALKTQIDALSSPTTRVDLATLTTPFALPAQNFVKVPYKTELVDELSEVAGAVFTPKEAGDYLVCASLYAGPSVRFELDVYLDNVRERSLGGGFSGTGGGCRVLRLTAGVKLDVRAYAETAVASVPNDGNWDWFTITRVR